MIMKKMYIKPLTNQVELECYEVMQHVGAGSGNLPGMPLDPGSSLPSNSPVRHTLIVK